MLRRHDTSLSHLEAKRLEAQICFSRNTGGIMQAFTTVESAERKAMMKCPYWLAKQEIPHTTNFVGLVQSLGATYLNDLNLGGYAHYYFTRDGYQQKDI